MELRPIPAAITVLWIWPAVMIICKIVYLASLDPVNTKTREQKVDTGHPGARKLRCGDREDYTHLVVDVGRTQERHELRDHIGPHCDFYPVHAT